MRSDHLLVLLLVEAHLLRGLLATRLTHNVSLVTIDLPELFLVLSALIAHDDLNAGAELRRVWRCCLNFFCAYNSRHLLTKQLKEGQLGGGKEETRVCIINVNGENLVSHIPRKMHLLILDLADGRIYLELDG